jgi:hypothetical protein
MEEILQLLGILGLFVSAFRERVGGVHVGWLGVALLVLADPM